MSSKRRFDQRADGLVERCERALSQQLDPDASGDSTLARAMRYAVFNGGKRLRPLLVYASGEALGIAAPALDAPACAVELIHCYSLVHDDLPAMDDDPLRRGQPTVHLAFSEATAILAGDALQALAFEMLTDVPDARAARQMIGELSRACGVAGMAGGQALDLLFEGQRPDRAAVEDMFRRKTGALIRAAVLMPTALHGDIADADRAALAGFAETVGLAFQIRDDLLEIEGETESIGKASTSDRSRAKATWPGLFGIKAAHQRINELGDRARACLDTIDGDTRGLRWLADRLLNRRF